MLITEIRQALIGKTISYYDGWDGSSVRVFPEKGKGWGVFIPIRIIPTLIEKGEHKESNEIERCSFETTWKLL